MNKLMNKNELAAEIKELSKIAVNDLSCEIIEMGKPSTVTLGFEGVLTEGSVANLRPRPVKNR